MQKKSIYNENLQLFDEFGTEIFNKLHKAYWQQLKDSKDRVLFTKLYLQSNRDILSPKPSQQTINLVMKLLELYTTIEYLNLEKFETYKKAIGDKLLGDLLKDKKTDVPLLAFMSAIDMVNKNAEEVFEKLKEGNCFIQGDYLIIDGLVNPFIRPNCEECEEIESEVYKELLMMFNDTTSHPYADREMYIETEIKEFSRLFKGYESSKGWKYLCKRLNKPVEKLEELYNNRNEVIDGTYTNSYFYKNNKKRIIYGKLLAIKKYIEFLKLQLGTSGGGKTKFTKNKKAKKVKDESKNKTNSKLLPDILKNPNDIYKINEWLKTNNFIEPVKGNILRPYIWKGKKDNKNYRILSIVNGSDSEKAHIKKARTFSPASQIARLGITLLEMGILTLHKDDLISTDLARPIINYYHIDDPSSTIIDAFKENEWPISKDYKKYYLGLIKEFQ